MPGKNLAESYKERDKGKKKKKSKVGLEDVLRIFKGIPDELTRSGPVGAFKDLQQAFSSPEAGGRFVEKLVDPEALAAIPGIGAGSSAISRSIPAGARGISGRFTQAGEAVPSIANTIKASLGGVPLAAREMGGQLVAGARARPALTAGITAIPAVAATAGNAASEVRREQRQPVATEQEVDQPLTPQQLDQLLAQTAPSTAAPQQPTTQPRTPQDRASTPFVQHLLQMGRVATGQEPHPEQVRAMQMANEAATRDLSPESAAMAEELARRVFPEAEGFENLSPQNQRLMLELANQLAAIEASNPFASMTPEQLAQLFGATGGAGPQLNVPQ